MRMPDARTHARTGARRRLALALAVPLCLCASVPPAFAQQVGNAPERSPFRDILTHEAFTLFVGRFAGNPNAAGTGAQPGMMLGARLNVHLSSALDASATFGEALTSRRRIDAGGDTARVMSSINVRLITADLGLQVNLTGDKTWHGLAPYAYLGLGLATPSAKVVDPGGFELGTNFLVVPAIGTRYFISRRLSLHLEARDLYFRYTYPLFYFDRPYAAHSDGSAVLSNAVGDREWYNNYTLWVGVTYGFNF